jgi:hypothetical protein
MNLSPDNCCARCGRPLLKGDTAYRVKIDVTSTFDGYIPYDPSEDASARLKKIAEELKSLPPELIEEEIHQEFTYLICLPCKERFCANPLNRSLDDTTIPDRITEE